MTYLLALALGAFYCFGFAPFDFWPATAVAIAGLFWLLHRDHTRPVVTAWLFGVGKYGVGASWVYVSIHVYGNAPPPLAGALVVLFVATLAALFVLPLGAAYARLRPQSNVWGVWDVLLFTSLWVALDWVSTWLLTGFPWLLPGYAFMHTYTLTLAPVSGVLGLGFAWVLVVAGLVAFSVVRRWTLIVLASVPLVLAGLLVPVAWVDAERTKSVALVQGNIDQARKWLPQEAVPNVRRHLRLSAEHWDADVLVWPEAAITLYPQQAQDLLQSLGEQGRATQTDIVLGIPGAQALADGGYQLQNLAIGLGTARGRFAKHHLVPFGEYVPLEDYLRGLIEFFDLPMSRSSPGAENQPNLMLTDGEAAMAICYEIAYPGSMRQRAKDAVVLMTISNDTWFGESIGPLQHMQIAQMRAVENGRWLIRATNNGVTAIVNPQGDITAQLPQFEEGVLRGQIELMKGRTPYSVAGDWPVLMFVALVIALAALRPRWMAQLA